MNILRGRVRCVGGALSEHRGHDLAHMFEDFATINFQDCFEVNRVKGMITLPTVFQAKLPAFWHVPPSFSLEEIACPSSTDFLSDVGASVRCVITQEESAEWGPRRGSDRV